MAFTATDMSHLEITTSLKRTDNGLLVCVTCNRPREIELFSPTIRLGKQRPLRMCIYCRGLETFPDPDVPEYVETPQDALEEITQALETEEEEYAMNAELIPIERSDNKISFEEWLNSDNAEPVFNVNDGEMIIVRRATDDGVDYYIYCKTNEGGGPTTATDCEQLQFFAKKFSFYGESYS